MSATTDRGPQYRDPFGRPSYQPSPEVRRADARAWVLRTLRDEEHRIDHRLRELNLIYSYLGAVADGPCEELRTFLEARRTEALTRADRDLERLTWLPDL